MFLNKNGVILVVLVLVVAGGGLFLANSAPEAPHHIIEKAVGSERFFK